MRSLWDSLGKLLIDFSQHILLIFLGLGLFGGFSGIVSCNHKNSPLILWISPKFIMCLSQYERRLSQNPKVIRLVLLGSTRSSLNEIHPTTLSLPEPEALGYPRDAITYNILTSMEAEHIQILPHFEYVDSYSKVMFVPAEVKGQNCCGVRWESPRGTRIQALGNPHSFLSKPSGSNNQLLSFSPVPNTSAELLVSISTQTDTLSFCIPKMCPRVPPSRPLTRPRKARGKTVIREWHMKLFSENENHNPAALNTLINLPGEGLLFPVFLK